MLILFGVSFRTAPMAVRETLSFSPAEAAGLLEAAAAEMPGIEALVLSTCNRTEFYLADTNRAPAAVVGAWHGLLKRLRPEAPASPDDCHLYERHGTDAFRHLARLAGGLESAILGDTELLSQLRAAVTLAQEHGTLGPELSQATAAALRLGRAARTQTGIASGSAGIGSAVAATLQNSKRVAILGAGEAARSVARHLAKQRHVDLTFCNRTAARADRLALEFGGSVRQWEELARVLQVVDAVTVTTSAPAPVLDAAALGRIARRRRMAGHAPLVVVDAGFPPQVTAAPVTGVSVIPLDAIRQGEVEALTLRRAAVPAVEAMVDQAVVGWMRRRAQRCLSGAIRRLHEEADGVTRELADELVARGLSPEEAERILRRPLRRLLHEVVSELRTTEVGAA
jgi:glutamyl-tRNA reductase